MVEAWLKKAKARTSLLAYEHEPEQMEKGLKASETIVQVRIIA